MCSMKGLLPTLYAGHSLIYLFPGLDLCFLIFVFSALAAAFGMSTIPNLSNNRERFSASMLGRVTLLWDFEEGFPFQGLLWLPYLDNLSISGSVI